MLYSQKDHMRKEWDLYRQSARQYSGHVHFWPPTKQRRLREARPLGDRDRRRPRGPRAAAREPLALEDGGAESGLEFVEEPLEGAELDEAVAHMLEERGAELDIAVPQPVELPEELEDMLDLADLENLDDDDPFMPDIPVA